MLVTGGDFGAYAPILIALGLYAIVFAVVAELVFTAQHFVGGAVRRRSQRVLATGVSKP